MPACAPARLLPPVCLARCASVRLRPRPACHRRASVRLSPARSSVSGSARGFPSGTGAGRPSPPGSFASPAPRHLRRRPRPARLSRRLPSRASGPGSLPFSVLFLERGSKGNGSGCPPAPRPACSLPFVSPAARPSACAPGPPATGARPSACHRRALLYPAAPAAFHPAQEPGGLLRPALLHPLRPATCAAAPGPPACLAACPRARPAPAPSRFQFFFLRGDQRETGADARLRPGPPAPSRLSRPLRVRPPAPPARLPPARVRPPVTGALFCIRQRPRLSIRHRSRAAFFARLLLYPACAPARLLPPVCLARCASVRLRPARLLPPVFSPFFLKGTRADMPAAPFFPRGFSKGKGEKTEQSGRRPRAAGQGGFFRRATGKGKRSGVSAR